MYVPEAPFPSTKAKSKIRYCSECGTDISQRHFNAKTCSASCLELRTAKLKECIKEKRPRSCIVCRVVIEVLRHPNQLTCSKECRAEETRRRAKQHYKDNPEYFLAQRTQYKNSLHFLEQRIVNQYGGEYGQHQRMYEEQGGCCKICKTPTPMLGTGRLCVDHCHKTGRIRGLLCQGCNTGLGSFHDNAEWMAAASAYVIEDENL